MKSSELPEDFVSHIAADIEYNRNESFSFEHEDAINDKTEIKLIVPVITIKDSTFAVRGDISIIGGHPKTGKTSVCAFLLATALMKDVRNR